MQHLQAAILARGQFDGSIFYANAEKPLLPQIAEMLAAVPHLVLFHPQMMGLEPALALIEARAATGRTTHLYLLDSFFFCLRSYNHIDDEAGACLRCAGDAQGTAAVGMGCVPWPARDPNARAFIARLHALTGAGAVALFVQTEKQGELARRHFGARARIAFAGLWCADWNDYVDTFLASGLPDGAGGSSAYDVVYHGSRDLAKGIGWVMALAGRTPDLRYLVPIDRGSAEIPAPANVTVTAMRWETGLREAVVRAPVVLAPSLWSSPCEGALIKNIVLAKAPGVIDIPSAFSAEIPGDVVFKFSPDLARAADQAREIVDGGWKPDAQARRRWVQVFRTANIGVAERMLPQ